MEQLGFVARLETLVNWGLAMSFFSPFESIYRKMMSVIYSSANFIGTDLAGPFFISRNIPSVWMIIYTFVFGIALVLLAVRKFNRKDIG